MRGNDGSERRTARRLSVTALGLVLAAGCGGEPGDAGGAADTGARPRDVPADARTPDAGAAGGGDENARPAPSGRIHVDERFPAIPVEPVGHQSSLLRAKQWTIVGLAPPGCETCSEEVDEWRFQAELWTSSGLRAVVVAEGAPGEIAWLDALGAEGSHIRPFTTSAPMFRYTGELNRPSFVLVDTMGVVRFIARQSGTPSERWTSLGRNHRYQSAGEAVREEIVRKVFPTAAAVEIRRTAASEVLGARLIGLGLSPWHGVAREADGRVMGHALPIARDTDCDTCDPLYLVAGVTRAHVKSLHEIEPVVSLGERESTGAFFEALRGVGSNEDVARVPKMLRSPKADRAVREILALALEAASRLDGDAGAP